MATSQRGSKVTLMTSSRLRTTKVKGTPPPRPDRDGSVEGGWLLPRHWLVGGGAGAEGPCRVAKSRG